MVPPPNNVIILYVSVILYYSKTILFFCRLLEWDEKETFTCSTCESTLKEGGLVDIVCDGIMMGCKKHFMETVAMEDPADSTPIQGTQYSER